MLLINEAHKLITTRTGLKFLRGGLDDESLNLPYMQYDLIEDKRYNNYQVLKETEEIAGPILNAHYKNPVYSTYQYTIINDGDDFIALQRIDDVFNYMTTDSFKIGLDAFSIKHVILSPVTEINLEKQEFFERRSVFRTLFF